jgi:hypothetical protein
MRRFWLAMVLALTLETPSALAQVSETSPLTPGRTTFVPAEAPPPPPPLSAWERSGLRGFEVQVRAGVMLPNSASPVKAPTLYPSITGDATGDILEGKESPYGPDPIAVTATVGYRFFPWLSAGLSFSYATFFVNDGTDSGDYPDTTSQLERQYWSLAAYGRYYFVTLHNRLHPWVELGLGYSDDNASYDRAAIQTTSTMGSPGPELQQYILEEQGLVGSLTAGLDVRLATFLSLGPSLGYSRVVPLRACVTVNVDSMSPVPGMNTCSSPPVSANGYGLFSGGVYVKVTVGR